jgi:hypothetical protein
LLVVFSLFRPDYWRDQISPPYQLHPARQLPSVVQQMKPQEPLRLQVETENAKGEPVVRTLLLPVPDAAPERRLEQLGFITEPAGEELKILDIGFLSPAENAGLEPGFAKRILGFEQRQQQPAKEWFLLPPLLLCLLIGYIQSKRTRRTDLTAERAT